jgi:hypothetical protein
MKEIELLRRLVEAGDELYSAIVNQVATPGQREAVMEYAKRSNELRKMMMEKGK